MTSTPGLEDGKILKQDEIGRVWTPRERREALVAEFERSGMSGAAFARWAGIKYPTFANWLQRRRREGRASVGRSGAGTEKASGSLSNRSAVSWVEAVVEEGSTGKAQEGALVVHLGGGARMEVGHVAAARLAAVVLRELAEAKGC
jgi:hypothetical protein